MYRRELLEVLKERPHGLMELSHRFEIPLGDLEDDVRHLSKSLRHGEYRLRVAPARCRKCDFEFHEDKVHKPGKCPRCKGTWIREPLLSIEAR